MILRPNTQEHVQILAMWIMTIGPENIEARDLFGNRTWRSINGWSKSKDALLCANARRNFEYYEFRIKRSDNAPVPDQ